MGSDDLYVSSQLREFQKQMFNLLYDWKYNILRCSISISPVVAVCTVYSLHHAH